MAVSSTLRPGDKLNLDTIIRAATNGDLAVIRACRRADGQDVTLLAAIHWDGEEYAVTPLAELFDGNPYDLYEDPTEVS